MIRVRAFDRDGKPFELDAEGLLAVCIQHEMDHLDGKLFVDYLSELKRERLKKKAVKKAKRAADDPADARAQVRARDLTARRSSASHAASLRRHARVRRSGLRALVATGATRRRSS